MWHSMDPLRDDNNELIGPTPLSSFNNTRCALGVACACKLHDLKTNEQRATTNEQRPTTSANVDGMRMG